MVEKSHQAKTMLEGMGIFKDVSFVIDTSKGTKSKSFLACKSGTSFSLLRNLSQCLKHLGHYCFAVCRMLSNREWQSQDQLYLATCCGYICSLFLYFYTSTGDNADKHGYQVIFDVTELNRASGGVSTMVGTNEGSIVSSWQILSPFSLPLVIFSLVQ